FVAFWQRHADGNTTPFSDDDPAAGLLVFVAQHDRRGVFRFTCWSSSGTVRRRG
ncbi:MepB family protein, partial [Microbacterium sp. BF1]|uniref:MepB family protein n=1 Tax=Microbacterium sp. BF1 TaxID=2821146 RepID=UPI001C4DE469